MDEIIETWFARRHQVIRGSLQQGNERLIWSDRTCLYSKGVIVHRIYQSSGPIKQCLFAYFDTRDDIPASEYGMLSIGGSGSVRKPSNLGSRSSKTRRKAVCLVSPGVVQVHHQHGEVNLINLSQRQARLIPLNQGLLAETQQGLFACRDCLTPFTLVRNSDQSLSVIRAIEIEEWSVLLMWNGTRSRLEIWKYQETEPNDKIPLPVEETIKTRRTSTQPKTSRLSTNRRRSSILQPQEFAGQTESQRATTSPRISRDPGFLPVSSVENLATPVGQDNDLFAQVVTEFLHGLKPIPALTSTPQCHILDGSELVTLIIWSETAQRGSVVQIRPQETGLEIVQDGGISGEFAQITHNDNFSPRTLRAHYRNGHWFDITKESLHLLLRPCLMPPSPLSSVDEHQEVPESLVAFFTILGKHAELKYQIFPSFNFALQCYGSKADNLDNARNALIIAILSFHPFALTTESSEVCRDLLGSFASLLDMIQNLARISIPYRSETPLDFDALERALHEGLTSSSCHSCWRHLAYLLEFITAQRNDLDKADAVLRSVPASQGSMQDKEILEMDASVQWQPQLMNGLSMTALESWNELDSDYSSLYDLRQNRAKGHYGSCDVHDEVVQSRFPEDKRLEDVQIILSSEVPSSYVVSMPAGISVEEMAVVQARHVQFGVLKNMAAPLGRAFLTHGTMVVDLGSDSTIPRMDMRVELVYDQLPVSLDETTLSLWHQWPEFHNGVAAALRLSPKESKVDSSWIVFNNAQTSKASHGGFLLGLGLNGILRRMVSWHAYTYLQDRHPMTSTGLLLGLSVAYLGTADGVVTKLMSIHVPGLLPPHSTELNLSPITQIASLIGLGLLYYGTRDHAIARVMRDELVSVKTKIFDSQPDDLAECRALNSGMSIGAIMIGIGRDGNEKKKHASFIQEIKACFADDGSTKSDACLPGAILAYTLFFLKSNDAGAASALAIPTSLAKLELCRPDVLQIKILGRALILWDTVEATNKWVSSQFPKTLDELLKNNINAASHAIQMAYWRILAGACHVLGLKYAGLCNIAARDLLISFHEQMRRASKAVMHAPARLKVVRVIRAAEETTLIAMACVMAGSGDISVMRLVRASFGRTGPHLNYGSRLSTAMSAGLLFISGGTKSLGTSDCAILGLLHAFFPFLPNSPSHVQRHLQACRHLWTLALEDRLLVAREKESLKCVNVKAKLTFHNKKSSYIDLPDMIPSLDQIRRIEVSDPKYQALQLDLADSKLRSELETRRTLNLSQIAKEAPQTIRVEEQELRMLKMGKVPDLRLAAPRISNSALQTFRKYLCTSFHSDDRINVWHLLHQALESEDVSVLARGLALASALERCRDLNESANISDVETMHNVIKSRAIPATDQEMDKSPQVPAATSVQDDCEIFVIELHILANAMRKDTRLQAILDIYYQHLTWDHTRADPTARSRLAILLYLDHVPPRPVLRQCRQQIWQLVGDDASAPSTDDSLLAHIEESIEPLVGSLDPLSHWHPQSKKQFIAVTLASK